MWPVCFCLSTEVCKISKRFLTPITNCCEMIAQARQNQPNKTLAGNIENTFPGFPGPRQKKVKHLHGTSLLPQEKSEMRKYCLTVQRRAKNWEKGGTAAKGGKWASEKEKIL